MTSQIRRRRLLGPLAAFSLYSSAFAVSCGVSTEETPYYGPQALQAGVSPAAPGVTAEPGLGADPGQTPATMPPTSPGVSGETPPSPTAPVVAPPAMTPPPDMQPPDMQLPALLPNPPAPATFDLAAAVTGKTPAVDSDGDGNVDGVWVDTDADGTMDALAVDLNKDAVFDALVRDLDSDGLFEATVEMPAAPPPPQMQGVCKVELTVDTVAYGGKYGSRNSGAIWVTEEGGAFVRTLKVWAAKRVNHVQKWVASSGKDKTDAISGATLKTFEIHNVTWDCTNKDGAGVPFGKYILHTEVTSINGAGPYLPLTFERGEQPVEVTAGPQQGYDGATLKYSPTP